MVIIKRNKKNDLQKARIQRIEGLEIKNSRRIEGREQGWLS